MNLRIKRLNCPSPSSFRARCRIAGTRERGYALLIMMMMVTLLLVLLTTALPSIYLEGQREREEELIFRGNEYARAIGLFRRRFNRFPTSVNELLRTNGLRFLRHTYPDPMSRKGKWRFIHATINGALLDSKTMNPAGQTLAGAQNQSDVSKRGSESSQGAASSGQDASRGTSFSLSSGGSSFSPGSSGSSFSLGAGNEIQGAFIAGVASSSSRESIRVLNQKRHYDEWEFLGMEGGVAGGLPGTPAGVGGSVGTGMPAQGTPPGQSGSSGQQAPPRGSQTPQLPPLVDQPPGSGQPENPQ